MIALFSWFWAEQLQIKTIKTLQESQELYKLWMDLNPNLHFGDLTPETLENRSNNCRQLLEQFTTLTAQIQDVRTRLNAEEKLTAKDNTRVHQGVRASYGNKSPEYQRAQKTRNRRSGGRRSKAVAEVVAPAPAI